MDKQVLEVLMKMQEQLNRIEKTVNRIEASQTEDVIAMLKVQSEKREKDVSYLEKRYIELDKKVFNLEQRLEN